MSRRLAVGMVGAIAVLALACAAVAVAGLGEVGAEHAKAVSVLNSVRQHNNAVYSSLADPSVKGEFSNAASLNDVKAAMDDTRSRMAGAIATVEGQLAELKAEDGRLRSAEASPLTVVGRGTLRSDRTRVEAALAAFAAGHKLLVLGDANLRSLNTLLSALQGFQAVGAYVRAGDVSGAASLMPQVKQRLQDAGTVSKGQDIAPQIQSLVAACDRAGNDLGQALSALQSGDTATLAQMRTTLDADQRAISGSFDAAGYNAFIHQRLDPLRTEYEAQMRRAGFQVSSAAV